MFERNVGGLDRIARGVLGACLVAVAFGAFRAGRRSTAVAVALGSAGLLFNFATARCGLNKLLGIDTCPRE
ncbi:MULTISPECIES: YgaP family membrane protein [Halococcus]|uniref:Inner membrane protein YgaP-like transmembrane domain-containing protein n=1 Tax=Halococcus salifodinae DSM 8989 TaxID=1227456 RepID=M0N5P8_9EURY|nr:MULTISPECIES: DUF2892 domain-containing protein [Halococcus]EMA53201.1 hypothetical protein C450_07802 [Halococcus salifodinae DSM 8989]